MVKTTVITKFSNPTEVLLACNMTCDNIEMAAWQRFATLHSLTVLSCFLVLHSLRFFPIFYSSRATFLT